MDTESFLSKGGHCRKYTLQIWRSPAALQLQFQTVQRNVMPFGRRMAGPGGCFQVCLIWRLPRANTLGQRGWGAWPNHWSVWLPEEPQRAGPLPPWMFLRSVQSPYHWWNPQVCWLWLLQWKPCDLEAPSVAADLQGPTVEELAEED